MSPRSLVLPALILALAATGCASPTAKLTVGHSARQRVNSVMAYTDAAAPNYRVVMPTTRVNSITITIDPADWDAMIADVGTLYGPRGVQDDNQKPPDTVKPRWLPAKIDFGGRSWAKVGIRPKGSSSLKATWRDGTDRFPWKLDFSQYQDDLRFFGFRKLSFATNWADGTNLRDPLVNDVLEQAGLPAARNAPYQITLDHGTGPKAMGLYTCIEEPDDTLIAHVFGNADGNIYEPEGVAAGFAEGTRGQIPACFDKENNKKSGWDDVLAMYDAIHDPRRQADPAAWRAALEQRFDVASFLRWLALVAELQAWDTYGVLAHNYYLYDDPADHRLKWVPWDHNLDLDGPSAANVSWDRKEVGPEWPLIRFLLDDPVYAAAYRQALADLAKGPMDVARLKAKAEALAAVMAPVEKQLGTYDDARRNLDELEGFITDRAASLQQYLATGS